MTAFLLDVGLILVAAAACGSIAARLRLPRVIGEMVAGLVLGQSLLGHVWPQAESYLFGKNVVDKLQPLALLIVLLYVALVGSELDRSSLRGRGGRFVAAVVLGLATAVGGAAVLGATLSDLEPPGVAHWTYVAFLSGALLVTAVPVLARILDESGLIHTRVGAVTLTLSIADDFVAFSIVAATIAVVTHDSLALALAGTSVLAALAVAGKPADRLVRRLRGAPAVSAAAIGILALVAGGVDFLGASTLVAAFVVGALIWRSPSRAGPLPGGELIRVLVPLYIVYAALPVDVTRLITPRLAFATVLVTVLAIATKGVACLVAGRLLSLDRRESVSLAVLRNTRGLTELVALNLGYQVGLLSQDLYTVFFAMALLTTAASGAIAMAALRPLERRAARESHLAVDGKEPVAPKSAPAD
jgi:Kef-type K+ transport system membrane component KefB